MRQRFVYILSLFLLPVSLLAQNEVTVTDASIEAGQTVNWVASNTYILDGLVFAEAGAVLNIQAGTVIKAKEVPSNGDNTSALIIARDAQIFAEGTVQAPIIFTAEGDDLANPTDLTFADRGLWGGLIVLGNAEIATTAKVANIEGIESTDPRGQYGNATPNDAENSGVLRYISIRHGGSEIGAGNEINGLTMGGVGSGTTVEYIEVFSNLDDGFEWFGGTVNSKYLVAAFCGDDAFDYDHGYRGMGQFWFAIMDANVGGRGAEQDGGSPDAATPYAIPYIVNATYIGPGVSNFPQGDGGELLYFRDNAGGKYYSSILADYNGQEGGAGVTIEDLESGEDSRARLDAGDLVLSNNIWYGFANGNALEEFAPQDFVQTHLAANNNQIVDPRLRGVSRSNNSGLDPRPIASEASFGATQPDVAFFDKVGFYGAFNPVGEVWAKGWTALDAEGILGDIPVQGETIVLTDASVNAGETLNLVAVNEYILDGLVFAENGATVNIEAGTVIKAKEVPSNGDNTSALIIARGAQIFAQGTKENPIIFTAEADDLADPSDLTFADRGLWGGIIILGNAEIATTAKVANIEGIESTDPRGQYGNATPNDAENSGVLRYISIRHGGSEIGAGNEINGLTMGGVGSGTTIEYIEVFSNLDDGYEWFGGTVNTKYLVSAFCGDDAFDYDHGYRGMGQFWFAIMDANVGGRGAEQDGGSPDAATPYAIPYIVNATYIGPGASNFPQGDGGELLYFRDNAGGKYYSSILADYNGQEGGAGVMIEDLESGEDSRARLDAGDLVLSNNIWYGFANGNALEEFAPQDFVQTHLAANNNQILDPQFISVSRSNNGALDPRPTAPEAATGAIQPADDFFTVVPFYGAFDPSAPKWTDGWTAIFQEEITSVEEDKISELVPVKFAVEQNYPNPFNPSTTIKYSVPKEANVVLNIYNMLGQKIATLVDGVRTAGEYNVTWEAGNIPSGVYIYRLEAGDKVFVNKMTLIK